MKLSELKHIYMRPHPRLPKLIALALILWEMRKRQLPAPQLLMLPESLQPTGPGIYNLDCKGNGYRERDVGGESEVVVDDFPEIELHPELDCLAELVIDHNVRQTHTAGNRSTRNLLNRHPGSIGFFTGSAWDLIQNVSASKWKKLIFDIDPTTAPVAHNSKPLIPQDFLEMCLHVILTRVDAERSRRETGEIIPEANPNIRALYGLEFQGKKLGSGAGQPLTLGSYITDLYQLGRGLPEIFDLISPWTSIWIQTERCLEEAPKLSPRQQFRFGSGGVGVVFDFLQEADRTPRAGFDNPLIHQGWLSDQENGRPAANCVIIRKNSGHVAIFTRGVDFKSVASLSRALLKQECDKWVYEDGGVIFNGSHSRPEMPITSLPVTGSVGMTIPRLCETQLRLVPSRPFPKEKYAKV